MNRKERMKWLGTIALILGAVVLMVYAIVASWKANHAPGIGTGQKPAKEVLSGWIENAYIESCSEKSISVRYNGQQYILQGTLATEYVGVADLKIEDGQVLSVNAKPETIEGTLDSYTESTVQISGYEILNYSGELPVYVVPVSEEKMVEGTESAVSVFSESNDNQGGLGADDLKGETEVSQKKLTDLVVGTSQVQLVVAEGKACAVIQYHQDVYESIRVLIRNGAKLYYNNIYITSDSKYRVGDSSRKKNEVVSAGKMLKNCEAGEEIRFSSGDGLLYLCDKKGNYSEEGYEGDFIVRKTTEGYVLVNEVPIETYLRYVLPSEMPTYFSYEALKAQAVCARTFAYKQMQSDTYAAYGANLDDSTAFQVYHASGTYEITDRAVEDTRGLVLTYEGELIACYYYSTSTGYSENLEVWDADSPNYLVAENHTQEKTVNLSRKKNFHNFIESTPACYDSDSPYFRWRAKLSAKLGMDEKYGRLKKLTVNERSDSGYVLSLTITFEDGERTYDKENDIRYALGKYLSSVTLADGTVRTDLGTVPSACFEVTSQKDGTIILAGGGFGHGIGMSQYGADGMGQEGCSWQEILAFYYKGAEVVAE